jgi:hypothetical protein
MGKHELYLYLKEIWISILACKIQDGSFLKQLMNNLNKVSFIAFLLSL